ncbi:hypothetical protein HYV58_01025, partial [Candidatus Peregrinibacteria bacterium]|nr:hypothetical protein [Candidatus Peregrinibacteria bacterium]
SLPLTAEETPFFLKIILWNSSAETGDFEEISMQREEFGFALAIADTEEKGRYRQQALEKARQSGLILIHHKTLAEALAKKERENAWNGRSLIISEASRLEENFTAALSRRYTEAMLRPFTGEKAALLFGFIGMAHGKFSGEQGAEGIGGDVILNEEVAASEAWRRVRQAAENLPDCLQKEMLLNDLAPQENRTAWISFFANEVAFQSAPVALGELFERAANIFPRMLLQSEALGGDGSFECIRTLFRLDESWAAKSEGAAAQKITVKIPENFPDPYANGYFKACEKLFLGLIEEKKGRVLFLMSSKKAADAFYQALLPKVPKGVRMLGIGISGGAGKSIALFREDPARSVLFTTAQILPLLPEIEDDIEAVVFQKIPFDPPNHPVLRARGTMFGNAFEKYTLPRAVMRFQETLAELSCGRREKTCYLLDRRLVHRDYGRLFI